ncbi:MAG: DUF1844 domain-containing protein [Bradymonadales bacterium]|nr:DUF1844 domain-containing protein [Bradymonadales bacterium]
MERDSNLNGDQATQSDAGKPANSGEGSRPTAGSSNSSRPTAGSPPSAEESRTTSAASSGGYASQVDFTAVVLSMAQSVLIDLGVAIHPETGKQARNLRQACHTIDILSMLKDKTRGNLDPQEEKLLEGTLYQLRIAFVETKRQASSGS